MADISANFLGIKSPNPFWLASAPPTDKKINVLRALEAGWGGIVWKTLGSQVKNVSSRYSAVDYNGTRVMGFNNIELISDRPLHLNLQEIKEVVREFPDRAMIVSLMADNSREKWHELIKQVEDTGAHGLELNFGCPHGMTERGMGASVGQDPEIAKMVVEWVMEAAHIPVITKLTPNVHSVVPTGKACVQAGTNALSLINTIQSVTGINLDTLVPNPNVAGKSVFGGYCGPAVKPIALKMLATISQEKTARLWDLTRKNAAMNSMPLDCQKGSITVSAVSPNSHWLAAGDAGGNACVWDLTTRNPAASAIIQNGGRPLAFSPDSRWLVTGGDAKAGRLLDLTGANPKSLVGHTRPITAAAFSADSHWLVTGSNLQDLPDKTARLWDLKAADAAASSIPTPRRRRA